MKGACFTLTVFAEPWSRLDLSWDVEDNHLVTANSQRYPLQNYALENKENTKVLDLSPTSAPVTCGCVTSVMCLHTSGFGGERGQEHLCS